MALDSLLPENVGSCVLHLKDFRESTNMPSYRNYSDNIWHARISFCELKRCFKMDTVVPVEKVDYKYVHRLADFIRAAGFSLNIESPCELSGAS